MSKSELNKAIEKVAASTGKNKSEIAKQLFQKDSWAWFLIRQAA